MVPYYKKGWFKVLIGFFILCLLFISFLPYAVRYGIEQWYLKQGIDSVAIEDIDINLFSGEFHLKNLRASKDGQNAVTLANATVAFEWLPLFKKRLTISQLHLDGLNTGIRQNKDGSIDAAQVRLAQQQQTTEKEESAWGIGLQAVSVNDAHFALSTPAQKANVIIDHISLDKLESWSEAGSQVEFSGSINNSPLNITATLRAFTQAPDIKGRLKIAKLDIAPAALHLQKQLQELGGQLDIDADFNITHQTGKKTQIASDGTLGLVNLSVKLADGHIATDRIQWQGKINLQLSDKSSLLDYLLQGKIDSENVEFSGSAQQAYRYRHNKLSWDGTVKQIDDTTGQTQVTGAIDAQNINLQDSGSQQELIHSEKLTIKEIDLITGQNFSAKQITLKNLRTLSTANTSKSKQRPALLQAGGLSIDMASFSTDKSLQVGNIRLQDALIHINKRKDGQLDQLATLTSPKTKAKKTTAAKDKTDTLQLLARLLEVAGNSKLIFIDNSVTPAFKTELLIAKASISNIDSSKPRSASPFILEAKSGKYANVNVDGDAYPFSTPLSLRLNAKLKNLSLPSLSSYSAKMIGYDMRSGQLSATIKANIKKGKIDADNQITLANLEVRSNKSKTTEDFSAQLSMPLDSALSLLRDKNNNIKLSIPVKGDINKPDFDISGVINKGIGTAMRKASLAYLTHALQPYGSLITLAKLAKSAADHVSLNPIVFSVAATTPAEDVNPYSQKIAALMQERPKLRIKLCGVATIQDSQALIQKKLQDWSKQQQKIASDTPVKTRPPTFMIADEQLLELATQRADAIKDILTNQHNIDPARLFLCQPVIDKDQDAQPRVDLNI